MNEVVNNFLVAGDKYVPEMHLKQPGFTYSACGPFIKNKEIQILFIKMNLIKLVFYTIRLMAKSKDLGERTQSDKVFRNKEFRIASDPKYDGYQRGVASMVYEFFDKQSSGSGIVNEPSYQLANEFHKPIIRKFKKRKVYSSFRDNIWVLIWLVCNQ